MRGTALIEELSVASGLPDDLIGEELSRIIAGAGRSTSDVTLDDLRELLAAYLQDVLADARDAFNEAPTSLDTLDALDTRDTALNDAESSAQNSVPQKTRDLYRIK